MTTRMVLLFSLGLAILGGVLLEYNFIACGTIMVAFGSVGALMAPVIAAQS